MKSPKEYYPKAPETRFDKDGRPYHYLFYTLKPNYYELLDVNFYILLLVVVKRTIGFVILLFFLLLEYSK
jgi:hypothetical protein